MVGREITGEFPERRTPVGEEVLRVENLTGNGVENISFTLHRGEVLGFSGLLGCGRTETMQMIFGAVKPESGDIYLGGEKTRIRNTADAYNKKIGLIPEDRKRHGIFLGMTIQWNICISALKRVSDGFLMNKAKERKLAKEYVGKLSIRTPSIMQISGSLSGGNQQKVAVSKALATDADIIILDEPTRGIDVGAKQEMYELIRQMTEEGKSVIMVSSEMIEVMGLSDRIVVLYEGQQMGILERDDFDQERILTLASGITS